MGTRAAFGLLALSAFFVWVITATYIVWKRTDILAPFHNGYYRFVWTIGFVLGKSSDTRKTLPPDEFLK